MVIVSSLLYLPVEVDHAIQVSAHHGIILSPGGLAAVVAGEEMETGKDGVTGTQSSHKHVEEIDEALYDSLVTQQLVV
jgi:hypothetical protein